MSVSLMKKLRSDPRKSEEVAIATNAAFEQHWIRTARLLGLQLVPMLWNPFYPNDVEREALLGELCKLSEWLQANELEDRSYRQIMQTRVSNLIAALQSGTCDDFEFCFG